MTYDDVAIPIEIRERYLKRRQQDLESLRTTLKNRTLTEFARIGHQIKGNAASFGYKDLEQIAVRMETAEANQDFVLAEQQVAAFEKWLLTVTRGNP